MTKRVQQRFAPHNALALNPKAFGLLFDAHEQNDAAELNETGVAVVTVRGPLMHHRDFFFDSYESIKCRVAEALALDVRVVVLSIDSPGGLVSGAFDTARELRKMATDAGVELRAHVAGQATSAAYAMASAASWIGVSESASLGSVGVIDTMVDATAQNVALGLNVQVVTSGERKADGNPNVQISDEALAVTQRRVDTLAGMFFDLVTEHGWGGSRERLEALQASIVTGAQAVDLGLASEVATFEQSLDFAPVASATATEAAATEQTEGETMKATTEEDAVASLRKMAESEDDEESKRARAALKALGAEMPDDDEDAQDEDAQDEDAENGDDDEESKASAQDEDAQDDEDAKAQDDEDEPEGKGSAKALAMAAKALAKVHNLEAKASKKAKSEARATLLATRPDISPDMVAILTDPKMTDRQVKKLLGTMERGPARPDRVAAVATATGTRGEGQGDGNAARMAPDAKAALDVKMGLAEMTTESVNTAHKLSFGVRRPVQKGKGN